MAAPPKSHDQYTVAVLFAMEFEMTAFRYILDEEYMNDLPRRHSDQNSYLLGRLGGHNVVLAWLPGEQGVGAAAVVGSNLSCTFPSILWRLLVGIGGGVPSKRNDIRLGDVVVSMPDRRHAHGGVIQYDLGKDVEGEFRRKGFLAQPPARLRSEVVLMQSNQMVYDSLIPNFVEDMLSRGPRLRRRYEAPDAADILYEDDAGEKVVSRRPRPDGVPEIHYGLIASGNRVIVDQRDREKVIKSIGGEVLCFEMEAAGFAVEEPCLVIRGISDYADAHKSFEWQGWAAANAAACAKEILLLVRPEEVDALQSTNTTGIDAKVEGNSGRPGRGHGSTTTFHQRDGIQMSGGSMTMGDFNVGNVSHVQDMKSEGIKRM